MSDLISLELALMEVYAEVGIRNQAKWLLLSRSEGYLIMRPTENVF